MIDFKKSRTAIEIASLDKDNYSYVTITYTNKRITLYYHVEHVVNIDILSGNEEKGNLYFILKIIFHCIFIEKPCIFSKFVQLIMKV